MLYRDAGVNIDANNLAKKAIGRMAKSTFTPQVISDIGAFGSLFKMPKMKDPVLVGSCDGVGTKLTVAKLVGKHDTVGADLVNHCVNDILCLGARPLFFLDYFASTKTPPGLLVEVMKGLSRACRAHGCALVGGETAVLPQVFKPGEYDLVGFIVGVVDRKRIVDPTTVKRGDILVGIPSVGLHTNGFSLARKALFGKAGYTAKSRVKGISRPLGLELLKTHRSYFKTVHPLLGKVKALAHITGGGFYDNIERVLPFECSAIIHRKTWRPQRIFKLIQDKGRVPDHDMYRTFNMGIGMVLIANTRNAETLCERIPGARPIGRVVRGTFGVSVI